MVPLPPPSVGTVEWGKVADESGRAEPGGPGGEVRGSWRGEDQGKVGRKVGGGRYTKWGQAWVPKTWRKASYSLSPVTGCERGRGRERSVCTYPGRVVCVGSLECVAGGHSDRCGTCVAWLCLEEGRPRGVGGASPDCKSHEAAVLGVRVRAWWGNAGKKAGETHVVPFSLFAEF